MFFGDKKSNRTTNLDFPSVLLLNQGLAEANNNTKGRQNCFFSLTTRQKEEKGEKKRGKETVITLLRNTTPFVCSSTHSATKQLLARE